MSKKTVDELLADIVEVKPVRPYVRYLEVPGADFDIGLGEMTFESDISEWPYLKLRVSQDAFKVPKLNAE